MKIIGALKNKRTRRGKKVYVPVYEGRIEFGWPYRHRKSNSLTALDADKVAEGKEGWDARVRIELTGALKLLQALAEENPNVTIAGGCIFGRFFYDRIGSGGTIAPVPQDEEVIDLSEVPEDELWSK